MNNNGSECLMTVDGTDFRIQEPSPFDRIWYSHKFNATALRYELGVCIQTGWIVWAGGSYPPGDFPDLEIFRLYLKDRLQYGERVETDEGYSGDWKVRTPTDYEGNQDWKIMKGKARARHEAVNGKMKEFAILSCVYRGDRNKHYLVFHALAGIVQSEIMSGRGTFDVDYHIPRRSEW